MATKKKTEKFCSQEHHEESCKNLRLKMSVWEKVKVKLLKQKKCPVWVYRTFPPVNAQMTKTSVG